MFFLLLWAGRLFRLACGLGFRVEAVDLRVWGLGFRVQGLGSKIWSLGFRVQSLGFRV